MNRRVGCACTWAGFPTGRTRSNVRGPGNATMHDLRHTRRRMAGVARPAVPRHRPQLSSRSSSRSRGRCRLCPRTGRRWPALSLLEPVDRDRRALLFIDLETTGLAGGAGTYAFLVGCGWFDGATFRVRQFLLPRYWRRTRSARGRRRCHAADAGALVTYNGKTFDLPLIETRFLFHRMTAPFAEMPHVDMLHPARRLWRAGREGKLPGWRIGARQLPSGCAGAVGPWPCARGRRARLRHSVALLSLRPERRRAGRSRRCWNTIGWICFRSRCLTARAAQLLEEGAAAARTAREAYGLGACTSVPAASIRARACFARASVMSESDPCTSAEALRACAVLARRARQHDEAAGAWRRILELRECEARLIHEASEALAIHHEHRDRNLDLARDLARQSLQFARTASRRKPSTTGWRGSIASLPRHAAIEPVQQIRRCCSANGGSA